MSMTSIDLWGGGFPKDDFTLKVYLEKVEKVMMTKGGEGSKI